MCGIIQHYSAQLRCRVAVIAIRGARINLLVVRIHVLARPRRSLSKRYIGTVVYVLYIASYTSCIIYLIRKHTHLSTSYPYKSWRRTCAAGSLTVAACNFHGGLFLACACVRVRLRLIPGHSMQDLHLRSPT